jgi:hypothetical protein
VTDDSKIRGSEKITAVFGTWPAFHDANVHWLTLDSRESALGDGPTLEALVHAFQMTSETDPKGYYVLRNHCLIHIRFSGVTNIVLSTLSRMILFELSIAYQEGSPTPFQIKFDTTSDSELDKDISFECVAVEVISLKSCDGKGVPQGV